MTGIILMGLGMQQVQNKCLSKESEECWGNWGIFRGKDWIEGDIDPNQCETRGF